MMKKLGIFILVMILTASFYVLGGGHAASGKIRTEDAKWAEPTMNLRTKFFNRVQFILENHEELGLSASQEKAIKKLEADVKKDIINKKAQTDVLDVEVHTLMWEDPVDLEAINSLVGNKYEIKKEEARALAAAYAKLKSILTPEQRDKLKKLWYKQK